jgi:hypothetical protein
MKGLGLYWGVTGLFGVAMLFAGGFELTHPADLIEALDRLGYPHYALTLIGIGKLAGAVIILIPSLDRLKEWAFAGFAVDFYGAICSHVISGDNLEQTAPSVFVAVFCAAAYWVWKTRGPLAVSAPA